MQLLASAYLVVAKDIYVQVGGNTTGDGTTVFNPQRVEAKLGDNVIFNFTQGNHTATQSTFQAPCESAHDFNISLNGFDSGFQIVQNGSAPKIQPVPILVENENQTMWFFDWNTCGEGGVGVINNNESSDQTLAGFVRNAIRLNGTDSDNDTSSSSSSFSSSTGSSSAPSATSSGNNAANRALTVGAAGALPLFLVALLL
ncbi:hypothetical protein FA95DRAFT_1614116 [Auriscalpium vulgare]|uniref:Uncharacterized protein n=1 Tax=Auriscalpium vulgare TaxID=40419 RepID=A0ACB8R0U9_9AGAM|nr:hypothetical protein FA95DRAFT_1614116 [Auriscalpium vulgare]